VDVETTMDILSVDDQTLLIKVLLSSELNDIETGLKNSDYETYKRLISLYDRLRAI
jgi:Antirepressor AbbA